MAKMLFFFHEAVHAVASLSVCRLRSKIVRVEGLHLMITLLAPHLERLGRLIVPKWLLETLDSSKAQKGNSIHFASRAPKVVQLIQLDAIQQQRRNVGLSLFHFWPSKNTMLPQRGFSVKG